MNESVGKLRTFNELEHIVTGQLMHIVADQNRYSDSDFVEIVFAKRAPSVVSKT